MSARIGFIGLGVMGRPMALNLVRAGYQVVVHNRSREAVEALRAEGARSAASPREIAAQSDVVVTMLPDSSTVRAVVEGKDGVLHHAAPGSMFVDMSTIHPSLSIEIAQLAKQRGIAAVDAPVSGGDVGARDGTLSIMAGGEREDFARALPLLEVLGETVVHVGEAGAGQVTKACNQIVVAVTIQAVSEALVLGSKASVDPARILDVLSGGLAYAKVMEVRRRNFLEHDFTPGFRVDLHHKDLNIALETGDAYNVPLPATSVVQQLLRALRTRGQGGDDHSALLSLAEDLAAHRLAEQRLPTSKTN